MILRISIKKGLNDEEKKIFTRLNAEVEEQDVLNVLSCVSHRRASLLETNEEK